MDERVDIVTTITNFLDSGNYKDALNVANDEKYAADFRDNCWDLISILVNKIQDDTLVLKPSLYSACEELLSLIVQKAVPQEILLEFIEKVEIAKNEGQLSLLLPPMLLTLKNLSEKRGKSLEWCLGSLNNYIETIPIPDLSLEYQERALQDCDNNVRRITKTYSLIPPFYTPFIEELNSPNAVITSKQLICSFLVSLVGKPLIYIDLDPEFQSKSEIWQTCGILLRDICSLEKNLLKFLQYVESCHKDSFKPTNKKSIYDERSPYEYKEKINLTTLSGLYYIVYSGHFNTPDTAIPQVYSPQYLNNTLMLCVIHLLSFTECGPLFKAVALLRTLIDRRPNGLSHVELASPVHFELCKKLMNVAVFCNNELLRKDTINMITGHINKFDFKGRSMLIKYILEISNHTGMIGYAITLFKNAINEAFKQPELPDCFTGIQFFNMVKKICHLPHGAESDLVELADQITSSLNFLRYLALKDMENRTGIKDFFTLIESDYLDKLRIGINMSKAHYEVKLKDLEESKKHPEQNVKVSVNVGGNVLDGVPTDNQKEIIQSALNIFHLIECLVARLSECISINKMN